MDEIQSAAQRRHQKNASFAARGSSIQHGVTRTRFVSPDASPHTIQITGMVRFGQSGRVATALSPDSSYRVGSTQISAGSVAEDLLRRQPPPPSPRIVPSEGGVPRQQRPKKKLTSAPRYRQFFSFILIRLLLENADSHAPQYVRTLLVVLVTCRGLLHPGVAHCLTIPTDRRVSVDRRSTGPGSMRRGCFCFLKAIFRGLLLLGCHDLRVLDSIFTRFSQAMRRLALFPGLNERGCFVKAGGETGRAQSA